MADIHRLEFTIVIEDYDKWDEDECPDTRDQWEVLRELKDAMIDSAREYMANHPSLFPDIDML